MGTLNVGGGTLSFDSSGNWTSAPPGSIVNIQTNIVLTSTSTTSTSFVSSAIQVTITPKFASSKILIAWTSWVQTPVANNHVSWSLHRNGSNLETTGALFGMGNYYINAAGLEAHSVGNFIDFPNSTSTLTYNVYIKSFNGNQVTLGNPERVSYINAFEISQ